MMKEESRGISWKTGSGDISYTQSSQGSRYDLRLNASRCQVILFPSTFTILGFPSPSKASWTTGLRAYTSHCDWLENMGTLLFSGCVDIPAELHSFIFRARAQTHLGGTMMESTRRASVWAWQQSICLPGVDI